MILLRYNTAGLTHAQTHHELRCCTLTGKKHPVEIFIEICDVYLADCGLWPEGGLLLLDWDLECPLDGGFTVSMVEPRDGGTGPSIIKPFMVGTGGASDILYQYRRIKD